MTKVEIMEALGITRETIDMLIAINHGNAIAVMSNLEAIARNK